MPAAIWGVAAGFTAGESIGGPLGGVVGIMVGIAVGIVVGIAFGLRTEGLDLTFAIGPATQLSLDRRACIIVAMVFSIAGTIPIAGPLVGTRGGMAGIVVGIAFGISIGTMMGLLPTAWAYFVIARAYLMARRKVPRNLMAFLQDAHDRGVLRRVGTVYQFRHIELQHHLANQQT
ncbi:hypothetical protein [Streptomyces sp. NPDC056491]|uniref:hypothetical protein n=1 Tax=Streptomyces sp. NPDC056491 TaxID=3345837 RepID=UPI0036B57259